MLNAGLMTKPADLKQFAPTGKLRGGVVAAPAAGHCRSDPQLRRGFEIASHIANLRQFRAGH
jgi:hypothetical protein